MAKMEWANDTTYNKWNASAKSEMQKFPGKMQLTNLNVNLKESNQVAPYRNSAVSFATRHHLIQHMKKAHTRNEPFDGF